MGKVTIATGWGGEMYDAEYVNRLFRACLRQMSRPFDFLLYAGPNVGGQIRDVDGRVKVVETGLPYWWSGMPFWSYPSPGVETEARLFLDLDVVVVGSLDRLFAGNSPCCCSHDWGVHNAPAGRENDANPGVSLIVRDAGKWVWDEYVHCGKPTWNPMDHAIEKTPCRWAAQGIINERRGSVDLFPREVCASYKYGIQRYGMSSECVTVHFHGRPKPHEVSDNFVQEHWV